jgi:hypothetical protein
MIEYPNIDTVYLTKPTDACVTFERLEILYLGRGIPVFGFMLPHLRHASVDTCSHVGLRVLGHSRNLESLLIRSVPPERFGLDVRSFPNLKLLGIREERRWEAVHLYRSHLLQHIWLYGAEYPVKWKELRIYGEYGPIERLLDQFPGVSRITIDLSLVLVERRERTEEFRKMDLAPIGLFMRPPVYEDDPIINIEYAPVATGRILERVWKKLRR